MNNIIIAPSPVPIAAPAFSASLAAVSMVSAAPPTPKIIQRSIRILNPMNVHFTNFPKSVLLGFLNVAPHFGQSSALSLTSAPHSLQFNKAIVIDI
ncbi:MAG: hypothetical protein HWD82_04620 [Flavobacteriaceae bacterium]|nr:hypothetical protein [Flavobacteriaceae bacterium]